MSELKEQPEGRLRAELDEADRLLRIATPEQKPEARERLREALNRFKELVMYGKAPEDSRCA